MERKIGKIYILENVSHASKCLELKNEKFSLQIPFLCRRQLESFEDVSEGLLVFSPAATQLVLFLKVELDISISWLHTHSKFTH